jgi:penicillin-binding protein 2
LIGYVGELDREELRKLRFYGYRPIDVIGRGGIERNLNSYLKGENGGYQIETDSRGRQLNVLGYKKPTKGKDVYLTIDVDLQNYIYGLIKDKEAAVCLWDPKTGKVLSMVSAPSFDPNVFIAPDEKKSKIIGELFSSELYPMVNRNIQASYPAGSIFKIVTALAALETAVIDKDQVFSCSGSFNLGGRAFRCWQKEGHGRMDFIQAMGQSCNVYFYQTGLRLGVDNLSDYAERFGFGRKTGVNLPYETEGLVPGKRWKQKTKNEKWYDGETVIFSIGQGYFLATPLQILRMTSVIANGGYLISPQIIEKIADIQVGQDKGEELGFNKENIELVRKGLEAAVSDYGTGSKAQVGSLKIAGKTATAQVEGRSAHAWFTCFFPAESPEYALVVFIENGGSGGYVAAPLGQKIISYIKENYM